MEGLIFGILRYKFLTLFLVLIFKVGEFFGQFVICNLQWPH